MAHENCGTEAAEKMIERTFSVDGNPVAQPRHRSARRGTFIGHYIPDKHPVHEYKAALQLAAQMKFADIAPIEVSVSVDILAIFARPQSHWRKNGTLTKAARQWPPKNDWDNIAKAVCDALTGIAYLDDDQIVRGGVEKRYASAQEQSRTTVTVRAL